MPRTTRPIVLRAAGPSGATLAAAALLLSAGCASGGGAKPAAAAAPSSSAVTPSVAVSPTDGGTAAQVGGGSAGGTGAAVSVEETLPKNKLAALDAADKMINEGEDEKTMGTALKNGGKEKEGDDLIKSGEAKIARGKEQKAKAATIQD